MHICAVSDYLSLQRLSNETNLIVILSSSGGKSII